MLRKIFSTVFGLFVICLFLFVNSYLAYLFFSIEKTAEEKIQPRFPLPYLKNI